MKAGKTKIALVLPTLNSGGAERVVSELANYFSKKEELVVHLILFGKNPQLFFHLNENILVHKINSGFNDKLRVLEIFKRIGYIRRTIKHIKPDAILSFGVPWNNLVLLSLCNLQKPVYVSDRGRPTFKFKFTTEFLKSILYPRSKGIIAQTTKAYEVLQKRFPGASIKVIGNPIHNFNTSSHSSREKIILSVGRLIKTKHHDRLIDIFSKLNAPDWKLLIVGGNSLKQNNLVRLENQISSLNLKSRVVLTGESADLATWYSKSAIFAFTSSSEGFPNVIGEALSAGLPVVAYDCVAGPSEMIVDGDNGFLVPVFDDEQFKEKLQLLMQNETLRQSMAEKAVASMKKFSIDDIGRQFLEFILPNKNS